MEWIKVKVKHVLFDLDHIPDNVFRAWIKVMCLCAGIEKIPTEEQIYKCIGKDLTQALTQTLSKVDVKLDYILTKVFEDVNKVVKDRGYYREYMHKQRQAYKNKRDIENGVKPYVKPNVKCKEVEVEVEVEDNTNNTTCVKQKPVSQVKPLLSYYQEVYKNHIGTDYIPNYAKDGKLLKDLLKVLTFDRLKELIDKFFKSEDEFIKNNGYTVGIFVSQINKLQSQKIYRKEQLL